MTLTLNHWPKRDQFTIDKISDYQTFVQFKTEAGIYGVLNNSNYNKFLNVASKYGYWVETIEQEERLDNGDFAP